MMSKKAIFPLAAGVAFVSGGLFAATTTVVEQNFDTAAADASVTTLTSGSNIWNGYATITNSETALYTYPTGGGPLSGDTTKALSVNGNMTYTNTAASAAQPMQTVDLMVQMSRPDEALEFSTSDAADESNIQIAAGVETNGALRLYCQPKSGGGKRWVDVATGLEADSWHRVSFLFNYNNANRCQVRLDGEPLMTTNGYTTATSTESASDTVTGSWYALANNKTMISNVKVVGCTMIDDFVVKTAATVAEASAAIPATGSTDGDVPYTWYDEQGVAWSDNATYDDSGMTAKQKYLTGLTPFDGEKFEATAMTMANQQATLTIPAMNPPAGRKNVVEVSDSPNFTTSTTTDITGGATSVTVDAPDSSVLYYRIRSTTTTP